jgi:2-methylcitrate dehydratase PrpD
MPGDNRPVVFTESTTERKPMATIPPQHALAPNPALPHFTLEVARIASAMSEETVPPRVLTCAKHALLDYLGVTVAGSIEESARCVRDFVLTEAPEGSAPIIGTRYTTTSQGAALVNGVASHALDFDDSNLYTMGHPTGALLSALIPVAAARDLAGARLLTAMVAGMQAEGLVAQASGNGGFARGFHATGTFGVFGSAAGTANLLGFDADQTAQTLGLAGSQAAGLRTVFGTMGKHLNAAKAGANGLLAAQLVEKGFTGPTDGIEDTNGGFSKAVTGEFDAARTAAAIRDNYVIEGNIYKRDACCAMTHASIWGVRDLQRRHGFSVDDVEEVVLHVCPDTLKMAGIERPTTGLEGKFSLAYVTARALLGLSTTQDAFDDKAVADSRTRETMTRVTTVAREGQTTKDPDTIIVRLGDGRRYEVTVNVNKPSPPEKMEEEGSALATKFVSLTAGVLGEDRANAVVAEVNELDSAASIRTLLALVRPEAE